MHLKGLLYVKAQELQIQINEISMLAGTFTILYIFIFLIYSDTFARVQEETDSVWKVSFFFKVQEYLERPLLIPPFIFLEHVYRLCCLIGRKMCSLQLERYGMRKLTLSGIW